MEKKILKNGLTLISEHNPNATYFSLSYTIKVGSFYEGKYSKGISHLIEHMLFKGTKNRTYQDINQSLTRYGGHLNASTSFDSTSYYGIVPHTKWEEAVDVLHDMIWNATFPIDELEKEKRVVIDEIKMYQDDPSYYTQNLLQKHLFQDLAECKEVAGNVADVKKMKVEELRSFYEHYYVPENMAVIATGYVNKLELEELLESLTLSRKGNGGFAEEREGLPLLKVEEHQEFKYSKRQEQASLSWGFFGPAVEDPDLNAFEILTALLGQYPNSRLYASIREEHGISYDIFMEDCHTPNQLVVYGGLITESKNILKAKELVLKEFEKVCEYLIDEDELKEFKSYMVGSYLIQMNNVDFMDEYLRTCYLYDSFEEPDAYLRKLVDVTAEEIRCVAKKYFQPSNIIFVNTNSK